MESKRLWALPAVVALAMLTAGCGGSAGNSQVGSDGRPDPGVRFPVTVTDATGKEVRIEEPPRRIVSLSPSATETLFAVEAGEQVIAVDDQSDYPPRAPRTELSSYQPNVEAIAAYRPDLVVVPEAMPRDAISGLRSLGLAVFAQPAPERLAGAYRQIRELGTITGHPVAGSRVARRVHSRLEAAVSEVASGPPMSVFHELDPELFSASSESFIGRIYEKFDLRNIADPAGRRAGTPYPQMSSEAVVDADPDLIILADSECCGQTPEKVRRRAGWNNVSAVRTGAVVAISDDIASRWGPRIPVFAERVAEAIETARDRPGTDG